MDALAKRALRIRQQSEEPSNIREYIREAFYRHEAGYPQVAPEEWFKTPKGVNSPQQAEVVYDSLEEATTAFLEAAPADAV